MRTLRVTRYVCDHCKVEGSERKNMVIHEKYCEKNPSRHCTACDNAGRCYSVVGSAVMEEARRVWEQIGAEVMSGCMICGLVEVTNMKNCPEVVTDFLAKQEGLTPASPETPSSPPTGS